MSYHSLLLRLLVCLPPPAVPQTEDSTSAVSQLYSRVQGTVTAARAPVQGARMTVFEPSLAFFRETRTAADGTYRFERIPPGNYLLAAAAIRHDYEQTPLKVSGWDLRRDFTLEPESHPGAWRVIGTTDPESFDATDVAILTPSGHVFFCHDTVDPIDFDPVTGGKTFPSGSSAEQGCMSASLLDDGRILFAGGQDGSDPGDFRNAIPWVKTYEPATDRWTWLADLELDEGRWYPGLARMADGSFLVMGGGTAPDAQRTPTCERFQLASETWTFTGSMVNPCEFPPAALLYTGEVLATWSPPQLYNVQTGTWRATGDFVQPDRGWPGHSDHSLVVLGDGRALAIGIRDAGHGSAAMGEIFDPLSETWSVTKSPELVRLQAEVVQLPDGRILVAGGETKVANPPVEDVLGIVKWCDVYDLVTDSWRRVADLLWFREYHAVTLLVPDGRVVTTGGTLIKFQYGPTSNDIEAFEPPYLFRGIRPRIKSLSSTDLSRGGAITLEIFPSTRITHLVLMGMGAPTHWVDGGIPRRIVLPVEQAGTSVTAVLPSDPDVVMLGHYLLFAMVDDIPSKGKIVRVR